MMEGAPKENANPIVHEVQEKRSRGSRNNKPLGWAQFERLNLLPEQEDDVFLLSPAEKNPTAADRAVFHALTDAAAASPHNVSLLLKAGIAIPSSTGNAPRSPSLIIPTPPGTTRLDNVVRKRDEIDSEEVFAIIRNIQDPEHPLTLEQLNVVNLSQVEVNDSYAMDAAKPTKLSTVDVRFTPTIPHCSMATLIGLCIQVKLLRSLPRRFKISVRIQPGTHASEQAVNKQLADKERVCAALENKHLLGVVNRCIENGMKTSD